MTEGTANRSARTASVQVWGKGYRVTEDSEEFQRLVPGPNDRQTDFEQKKLKLQWGRILSTLYSIESHELAAQRCILFDPSKIMALTVASTEDRHQRPSLLVVAATIDVDWLSPSMPDDAARLVALSGRLAVAYATNMHGNPERIGEQLRRGNFLGDRSFEIGTEEPDVAFEWHRIFEAVRKWQGITGVATTKLVSFGANVALGTTFEAERARQEFPVDGYFDVRDRTLQALGEALVPWVQEVPQKQTSIVQPPVQVPIAVVNIDPVVESLNRIEKAVVNLADRLLEALDRLARDKRKK